MSQQSRSSRFLRLFLAAATLSLSACASHTATGDSVYDPFEPLNRTVYGLNEAADILLIGPAATIYREGVPQPVQTRVRYAVQNLELPVIAANKLLQGNFEGTGTAVGRFAVNSTLGVLGIFDVATDWGMPYEKTDFGVTLASWGLEEGPYLFLPLVGPSNLRDGVGRGVDMFGDPVRWATKDNDGRLFYYVANALRAIDARGGADAVINDARTNSLDSYATLRSYYSQHRASEVEAQTR